MLNIILKLQDYFRARTEQGQPTTYFDAINDVVDLFLMALINRFIEDNHDEINESVQKRLEQDYAEEGKDLDYIMDDTRR